MSCFSERLKFLRTRKNITQQELAESVDVSRTAIAGYERLNKQPNFGVLIKIAKYFNVTTDYLLGSSDREFEQDSKAYFAKKIDAFFAKSEHYKNGICKPSSFVECLYEIIMKSYDYEIFDAVFDAAIQCQDCFLDLFDYIDKVNETFDSLESAGLNKAKLKSDSLKANTSDLLNDVREAMEGLINYCCEEMSENSLYNHQIKSKK